MDTFSSLHEDLLSGKLSLDISIATATHERKQTTVTIKTIKNQTKYLNVKLTGS
jgi:hypothetical protein